jgi:hypothetical protein
VLAVVSIVLLVHRRRWQALTLLPALATGGAAVLLAKHAIPYDRTWIYILPFAFVIVDAGFSAVQSALLPMRAAALTMLRLCGTLR